jgi:hypothetical protein
VQVAERVVLELALDPVDAEAVRERRVDVERLLRDLGLALRLEGAERPHVVRAVGELHEDDADVARHREQHLPEVLGLLLLARGEADLADLRDAVDERRDLGPEELADLVERRERVLDGVVQEPGDDARHVEPHLGDDAGDVQRMREVRLAGGAALPFVHLGRERVGALDRVGRGSRIVMADALRQLAEGHPPKRTRARSTISSARSSGVRRSVSTTTS